MKHTIFILIASLLVFSSNTEAQVVINELLASNLNTNLDEASEADDWLELYNTSDSVVDISGWFLSDDPLLTQKWPFPNGTSIPPNGFLLIWTDNDPLQGNLHATFKLSAGGEKVLLSNSNGIIDSLSFGPQLRDISYGREDDGSSSFVFFTKPTPNATNNTQPSSGVTTLIPNFSINAGFYNDGQTLELHALSGNIYFTTDGSEPTINSEVYSSPIIIDNSTVVRARVIEQGSIPGVVLTNSYFIDEGFDKRELPVISLSTNDNYFFQADTGIYVQNFKPDWEYPINIEFFENSGKRGFSEGAGVKVIGERSWVIPQKMLGISFKSKFGSSKLNYQLFPNNPVQSFESIALRASGSDWGGTLFRDGMQQQITHPNMDTDIQEFRPTIVYLNGKYLGIHNIRSRVNQDYLKERYQISDNDFEMVENNGEVVAGSNLFYNQWYNYIDENNFFNQPVYDYVKTLMEVDNFIDYMITWVFSANISWGEGNIAMYRSRDEGKWRWLIMDFDRGFDNPNFPNMEFFTEKNNPGQNNPLWASLPLRKLLKNEEFKQRFIQRFADNLYTTYHPTTLHEHLNNYISKIDQEINRHGQRWGDSTSIHGDGIKDTTYWQQKLDVVRTFIDTRNDFISNNLINYFGDLSPQINLNLNTTGKGQIILNDVRVPQGNWEGNYFNNRSVQLTAIPESGYQFSHWLNVGSDSLTTVKTVDITKDTTITAVFIPATSPYQNIVINEIKFENANGFATDWVELYNPNNFPVYLDNWKLREKASGNYFLFNNNTVIEPKGYLVASTNKEALAQDYASLENHVGNLPYNLSQNGETIELINQNNETIDLVSYTQSGEWPKVTPNKNQSIQLINWKLDNNKGKNWGVGTSTTINTVNSIQGFVLTDIASQFINQDESFNTINLNHYLTSTNWPKSTMQWSVVGNTTISISIEDSIATITYPTSWTGIDSALFTATNPDMESVNDVVFFGVGSIINKDDDNCNITLTEANSPYIIPDGIVIKDNCNLSIEEGASLLLGYNADIEIKGTLNIAGTSNKPVTINGFEQHWGALKLKGSDDVVNINYLNIEDASYSKLDSTLFNAAVSVYMSELNISNSTFSKNQRSIYSMHAKVHIDNCLFKTDNTGEKVNLQFTDAITENSTFEYTYGDNDGLDYDAVFDGIIRNNTLLGGQDDGIDIGQIEGVPCNNVLIENNISSGYSDKAISVGEASKNIMIQHNLLLNSNSGVSVKDRSTAFLYHNTIDNNKFGVACFEKNSGALGGVATITNCIISNSDSIAIYGDASSEISSSYTLTYPQSAEGNNMLNQPPVFNNTSNFSLNEASPAIDAGTNILGLDPDGTTPDIGAKHFNQSLISEEIISVYPNPAIKEVTIDFKTDPTDKVVVTLNTITGIELQRLELKPEQFNNLNRVSFTLDHNTVAAGIYLITLYNNDIVETQQITLLRDE